MAHLDLFQPTRGLAVSRRASLDDDRTCMRAVDWPTGRGDPERRT